MSTPFEKSPLPKAYYDSDSPVKKIVFDGTHGKLSIVSSPEARLFPQTVSRDEFVQHLRIVDQDKIDFVLNVYDNTLIPAYEHSEPRRDLTPAVNHPIITATIVAKAGIDDPNILNIALLHDTVEDTPRFYKITKDMTNSQRNQQAREQITTILNSDIADGVLFLTKPLIDGVEVFSEEQVDSMYREQLLEASEKDPRLIVVKVADRIHNLFTMDTDEEERRHKQAIETLKFYQDFFDRSLSTLPQNGRDLLYTLLDDGLIRLNVPLKDK